MVSWGLGRRVRGRRTVLGRHHLQHFRHHPPAHLTADNLADVCCGYRKRLARRSDKHQFLRMVVTECAGGVQLGDALPERGSHRLPGRRVLLVGDRVQRR